MNHRKARRLISEAIDGRLSAEARSKLEKHLEKCPSCRAYLASLERIQSETKGAKEYQPEPGYWDEFSAVVDRRIAGLARGGKALRPAAGGLHFRPALAYVSAAVVLVVAVYLALLTPGKGGGEGLETAWLNYGARLAVIVQEAEVDPELESSLDREIQASIAEALITGSESSAFLQADDPFFWESLTTEEMEIIVEYLENKGGQGEAI